MRRGWGRYPHAAKGVVRSGWHLTICVGSEPIFPKTVEKPHMTCPECSGPMPATKATGRPATYCSPTCRRAAEYAIRRAQVLLTRAQRAEQDARLRVATGWGHKDDAKVVDFWSGEVDRLRGSLRELLDGTDDDNSPGTVEPRP